MAAEKLEFKELKLSAMMHLGIYSCLGGEWQGQTIPWYAEWIKHTAKIADAEYRKLVSSFQPNQLEPERLIKELKELGFQSFCFTAKHHDGFALYPSKYGNFNSERDFLAEFSKACKAHGLGFSIYYSQAQDWSDQNAYSAYSESEPEDFERYFYGKCLAQIDEILSNYGPLQSIWFDTPDRMPLRYAQELRDFVKARQADCLISGRIGYGLGDYLTCADNTVPAKAWTAPWELPISCGESWAYKKAAQQYKSFPEILDCFLKTLSRGGHFLLNLGPKADGSLVPEEAEIFAKLGDYVQRNKAAIFKTQFLADQLYEISESYFLQSQNEQKLHLHILNPKNFDRENYNLLGFQNELLAVQFNPLKPNEEAYCLGPRDFYQRTSLEGEPCWTFKIPSEYRTSSQPYSITFSYGGVKNAALASKSSQGNRNNAKQQLLVYQPEYVKI
ncbi:MAG: alpha-L-fucosidase [Eubacteriales bacterium]|nr:alpha-L-fucosidase [Eubacteriales bacterium]